MMLLLSCLFIVAIYSSAGLACTPMISIGSNSKPDIDGHIYLECEISTCTDVHMIVYDRTGVGTNGNWTPVYEGFNKTHHHALETGTNYTLEHRDDYTAFPTKHILNVQDLILKDHGEWRCNVIDVNQMYASNPLEVTVYVTPREDSIYILLNTTSLVDEQTCDFVCLVDGIHPQPDVIWNLNGGDYVHGTAADIQRKDGLWKVHNTIQLSFNTIGKNVVNCIMTKPLIHSNDSMRQFRDGDVWLEDKIDIDVKESAQILYPQEDVNITENADSTFTLNCNGSGYRPNITWTKDGEHIIDHDHTYTIINQCNGYFCGGSLTPLPDPDMPCSDSGVYTCIISLAQPYESTQISSNFNVYGKGKTCYPNYRIFMITIVSVLIGIVIVLGSTTCIVVYCKKRKPKISQQTMENIDSPSCIKKTLPKTSQRDKIGNKSKSNLYGATNIIYIKPDRTEYVHMDHTERVSYINKDVKGVNERDTMEISNMDSLKSAADKS